MNLNQQWRSNYTSIDSFYIANEQGYAGMSIEIRDSIQEVTEDIVQTRQSEWHGLLDTVAQDMKWLETGLLQCQDPVCYDSIMQLLNVYRVLGDSLEHCVMNRNTTLNQQLQSRIEGIISTNSGLPDTSLFQWSERIVLDIMLRIMEGDSITTNDKLHLETIAMSCDEDAGRWVYWARALCWQLYGEYYDEKSCIQSVLLGIGDEDVIDTEIRLVITPNPTFGEFKVAVEPVISNMFDLNVYNLNGQLIYQRPGIVSGSLVDGSSWINGTYLIEIVSEDFIKTTKVLIQND